MKMLNVKVDDWTHKNIKALAALKETTVATLLKLLVEKEIEDNPEECELCRKYGHEPNEETRKALETSMRGKGHSKPFKTTKALFDHLDKE